METGRILIKEEYKVPKMARKKLKNLNRIF